MRQVCLAIAATALLVSGATAQTGQPARAPLRPDLAHAASHLAAHPHPYEMSEEVARERLKKSGFESSQELRAAGESFETTATRNGVSQNIRINRLSGTIEELNK